MVRIVQGRGLRRIQAHIAKDDLTLKITSTIKPISSCCWRSKVSFIDITIVAIFNIDWSFQIHCKHIYIICRFCKIRVIKSISSVDVPSSDTMLARIFSKIWRVRLWTSDTSEHLKITVLLNAWHPINQCSNVIRIETIASDCDELTACSIPWSIINWIDDCHGLCLITTWVIIAASPHWGLLMKSIAYSESKIYISRSIWSDGSHNTSHLRFLIRRKVCCFLYKSLKINSVAIDSNLNKWKLWQELAFILLGFTRINNEADLRTRVDNLRHQIV